MHHRTLAGVTASVLAISCIAQIPSVIAVDAADSYSMQVSVNLSGEKKEISPYIYGVNEYSNTNNLKNVTTYAVRQGGNRYTSYNWETNYSNAGEDWINSSDTNIGDVTDGPAYAAQKLSQNCQTYDIPYKMTTLQMAGYVAADKNGTVSDSEAAPSDRWNTVKANKDGELSLTPDLTDGTVYMDEYVNYLVQTLGDATTETGIQGYSLDNEPVLWNDTHPLNHSNEVTNSELISKSVELAKVIKEIDPNAEVFGPAFWGVLPCIQISDSDADWQAVKSQYSWYLDYYLDQMADAEQEAGERLLDVVDVHYYAQDCTTDAARMQAARSLYDESYTESSWLGQSFSQYLPFLPAIRKSIDTYYPGTKIAISEYNLGDISNEAESGKMVSSAIAETEALGAFADQGVYLATYWGTLSECPYVESAINLYTNYDGNGAAFGDTLVEASTDDLSLATAFASINGSDDSNVTTVLSNKDTTKSEQASITLNGSSKNYQSAVVYAITPDSSDIKMIDVQNDITNNTIQVELPPMSVAQVVISDDKTEVTIPDEPNIRTEKTTYQISDLELSENGYPMIPLGDKEHLKEFVLNTTVTSNAGSTWCSGGGALCFNKVVETGTSNEVWGNKSFSYRLGTTESTIPFDDSYTIVVDEKSKTITASVNDTYTELQNWWASSENDPEHGTDITATFNRITLIYEYDDAQTSTTTEPLITTTAEETTTLSESQAAATETMTTLMTTESTTTESAAITSIEIETTTTPSETTAISDILYGDVNIDGKVDLTDAILLNKAIADQVKLNGSALNNADCNADAELNGNDAIALLRFLVHLVDTLPAK